MAEIGLGEAIMALRGELTEARAAGDGAWMRFEPGPVELVLEVAVTKDIHGQVGWKVLEVGAARQAATTQTVKVTLTPQWWDPEAKQYTTDFLVAGVLPDAVASGASGAARGPAGSGAEAVPALPDGDTDPE